MKVTDRDYYMDGYLSTNLNTAKRVIKKDWDMIFAVDGAEGSGKSVITQQMAYYCDPSLSLRRITFTPSSFETQVKNAKQYESVIFDEAYRGLSSRATMTEVNKSLVRMLAEIRQKNLFIFIVMPTFFDLDKYVALWRSRALIHVYTGKDFERGFFAFYNIDKKKDLYVNGKKLYSYSHPRPNFIGRFTNVYTVDEEAYRRKKRTSLIEEEEENKKENERDVIIFRMKEFGLPDREIAQYVGCTRSNVSRILRESGSERRET